MSLNSVCMCVCVRINAPVCMHTEGKEKEVGVVQVGRLDIKRYEGKYQSHRTDLERVSWLKNSSPAAVVGL